MSLADALGATDPQGNELNTLFSQRRPDLAENPNVDPQTVMNRMVRKQYDKLQANQKKEKAPLDFSTFGTKPEDMPPRPSFSDFGEPVDTAAKPEAPPPTGSGVTGTEALSPGEASAISGQSDTSKAGSFFERRLVEVPVQVAGGMLQGMEAGLPAQPVDDLGRPIDTGPSQPERPASESPIYKAGENLKKWGELTTEKERAEHPFQSALAGGIGGVAPFLALGALNPVAAMASGAAMMGFSTAGDTYEHAKKQGASEDVARQAAGMNGLVGAALGSLPIASVLKPLVNALPKAVQAAFSGRVMSILAQAGQNGIVFTTVGEAQEYIAQEIAKDYDKTAGYSPDIHRILGEAATGAIFGAGHAAFGGHAQPNQRSDPNATADQDRRQYEESQIPEDEKAARTAAHAAWQKQWDETPAPTAEEQKRGAFGTMRDTLKNDFGFTDDELRNANLKDLRSYLNRADALAAKGLSKRQIAGMTPEDVERGHPAGGRASDDEVLRGYGFTPEEVAKMTPEERAATIKEAEHNGVRHGKEEDLTANEFKPADEEAAGTREAPVEAKTAEDVAKAASVASQDHTPEQGEANNVQRGHAKWNGLDITIEAPAGGKRNGTNPKTGEPWETSHSVPYGYIKGTKGADGMHVDVYMGEHPTAPTVYVMDEKDGETGKFRQHKAFIGFQTPNDAIRAYAGSSSKRPEHVGGMRVMSVPDFKGWLKGDTTKAASDAMYNVSDGQEPTGEKKGGEGVIPPGGAATAQHREAIEKVLRENGIATNFLRPRTIAQAAEIHAHEGLDPKTAWLVAFSRDAVADGLLTPEQVKETYGEEVANHLEPADRHRGAGKVRPEARGPAIARPAPAGETERVRGGGEARPQEAVGAEGSHPKPDEAGRSSGTKEPDGGQAGVGATSGSGHPEERPGAGRHPTGGLRPAEATPREPRKRPEVAAKPQTSPPAATAPLIGEHVEKIGDHKVTAADGASVKVKPVVVEAADLITSSDAGYDKALQPRQRERAASEAQIREIATRLDPERLGYSAEADRGAPIVGPDRMVESGNGRVMALRKVYGVMGGSGSAAKKYRDWLKSQGVDVSKYKEPILVRQRVTDLDEDGRRDFVVAANQAATLSMSAPERAMADAGHVTPDMLDLIKDSDLGSIENRAFVRAFVGTLPASERGNLTGADGGLSAEGLARVRNAILAKAYGDADILARITESTDDDVKSISNALVGAAPTWAKMRAEVAAGRTPEEMDITTDLMEAVKRTADIRSKGMKIDDYLAQDDAFDKYKDDVDALIAAFYDKNTRRALGAPKIRDFLEYYAREAAKVSTEEGLALGLPKVTPNEIREAAIKKSQGARPGPGNEVSGGAHGPAAPDENRPGSRGGGVGRFAEDESRYGAEPGAEGRPQLVIPGGEQRSGADLAKRRASEPLKPKVAQKPVGGLFGDDSAQLDLVDQARKAARPSLTELDMAFQKADDAWSAELQKAFSKEAGDKRYSKEGRGEPGSALRKAYDARDAARQAREDRLRGQEPTKQERAPTAPVEAKKVSETAPSERERDFPAYTDDNLRTVLGDGTRTRNMRPEMVQRMRDELAAREAEKVSTPAPSTKPQDAFPDQVAPPAPAPQITEKPGNEHGPADLFGPRQPGVRPAAPAISKPKSPGGLSGLPARRHAGQLSLFGGEPSGGNVPQHPVEPRPGPESTEPPVPSEGPSVTKPPSAGGGTSKPRPDKRPGPRDVGLKDAAEKIAERSRFNYRITDDDHLGEGGPKAKARANLEAIRTLQQIESEGREATAEEKAKLVKYVGWGALSQPMFKDAKAEWKAEREELRALLTPEEYEGARASTLNAHYTSPDVIRGIWDTLDHLGFKGGLAIEPAAGVGHFIGLTPDGILPKTAWTAVELDPITGRIAKKLYAGAEVNVHGYEDLKRPSNYYDLAISNVPFGDYHITEKPYGSFPIHDFFFVKSLDKVRPGGVVAFVTSRYTMDREDPATRRLLAKSADLVGAIRLPGGNKGAFAKNAGTEVTTDVLFLRKKVPGEPPFPGKDWHDLREVKTPEGPVKINEYFAEHPEMMLGEMRRLGTMYGKDEPVLIGSPEGLRQRIGDAGRAMPENALTPRGQAPPTLPASDIEGSIKDGAFFLKDGTLYQKRAGTGVEHKLNADDHDRFVRLIRMRGFINDLLGAQLAGDKEQSAAHRKRLSAAYEAFVRKWGPINQEVATVTARMNKAGEPIVITRRPNFDKFRADPDAFKVAAIEDYDRETGKAKPNAILTRDVIDAPRQRQINGPADALAASLDATGGVDLNHIADSLGVESVDEAVARLGDLIFQNPDGRQWQTADSYLSGDVVEKLEQARTIAEQDKSYERNVKALEKVQPEPLRGTEITAQFGAPWVPTEVYEDFFKTGLGATRASVHQAPITGGWRVTLDGVSRDARTRFGTDDMSVQQIASHALNNTPIVIRDPPPPGESRGPVNQKKTELARTKAEALKDFFGGNPETGASGWIWEDQDRAQRLEGVYNRTHNTLVPLKSDGSHLTLPGINPMFLELPHRLDAVWRMIQRGNTLLAHAVGSGKTVTMIAGGMEMKRLGLINKPAYVVPNHMLEQFSREFIQAYPNAKILVASKEETSADHRREFVAKVAANDWDGIVITHSAFGRINMAKEFRLNFIHDQLDELERVITTEGGGDDKATIKELEKRKKKLTDRLLKLMASEAKDAGTTFEESGIDHIFLDEAHKYKNLSFLTRMSRIKGLQVSEAQRSEDMFLKIRYLEQKRPGRSAVFATGTPVSNTMAELWTMQRYLQLDKLRAHNLDIFDNWANTFGRSVTNAEVGPDGRSIKDVTSFSRFVNIPELISLYSEIADSRTARQLNLKRPDVERPDGTPGITIVHGELSDQEDAFIRHLVELAERGFGKPRKGEPNMLSAVVTPGRKVATDGRLVGFPFNPRGKIARAVDNIHQIWKDGKEPGTVQMVFLDQGTPAARGKSSVRKILEDDGSLVADLEAEGYAILDPEDAADGNFHILAPGGHSIGKGSAPEVAAAAAREHFRSVKPGVDLYADIKQRLVDKGIPAKEIAFIHDADTDDKKGKMFAATRSGSIRVLLGSTEKMGVGTNVQTRLFAMHHIDPPWRPDEIEQRDGRMVRQGNLNPKVQMYRYVTPRSFDALMWQTLERKASFIGQVTSGAKGARTAEDIDNPLPEAAEMKAAASGDPRILQHAELDREVRQLTAQRNNFQQTKQRATWEQKSAKASLAEHEKQLPIAQEDAAQAQDLRGNKFKVTLGDKEITNRAEAGKSILDRLVKIDPDMLYHPKDIHVGTMSGFSMQVKVQRYVNVDRTLEVDGLPALISPEGRRYDAASYTAINQATPADGFISRFTHILDGVREQPARVEKAIATEKDNLARIEKTLKETWPREAEYHEKTQRLRDLTDELKSTYRPGLKAQGLDAGDALKRKWAEKSPIKTVDDLFAKAEENQASLVKASEAITAELGAGVDFKNPGVKGRERTQQKIDKGKAPGRINDVVRAGFVVERPGQSDAIVERLAKQFEIIDEGWAVTPAGYFDRKVLVRFPNGQVGEIQLWHPDMLNAKEHKGGHRLYVESSKLPVDHPRKAEIEREMKAIYEAALASADPEWKALLGNAGSEENLASNASLDITRPFAATSVESTRFQEPFANAHASPGEYTNGSPSNTPYLRGSDTSGSTTDIRDFWQGGKFAEAQRLYTNTPEFKRWFGESKVVNRDGSPKVVYHATDAPEDFNTLERTEDIGFHFGSVEAANDRLKHTRGKSDAWVEKVPDDLGGHWMVVKVPPNNDLPVERDPYDTEAEANKALKDTVSEWENARIIPAYLRIKNPLRLPDLHSWEPDRVIDALLEKNFPIEHLPDEVTRENVAEALTRQGYDGIVYRNAQEGKGSDSYIAFRPEQIKSATGNSGAFDPNNPSMLAEGRAQISGESRDLGPHNFVEGRPVAAQAQDHVLFMGRTTGKEHLLGVDQHGKAVANFAGTERAVNLSADATNKMLDPTNQIVVHHNHPSNGPLSDVDLSMLAMPGIKSIWAHGHEGRVTRAGLTPFGRTLMGRNPEQDVGALGQLAMLVGRQHIQPLLTGLVALQKIEPKVADHLHAFLVGDILRRAGLIDYHTSNAFEAEIEKHGLEPYIQRAADAVRKSIPNVATANPVPGDDRHSGTVFRHPGDVGAAFERRAEPPARRPEPGVAARPSGERSRQQAPPARRQLSFAFAHPDNVVGFSDTNDLFRQKHDMQKHVIFGLPLNPLKALEQLKGCSFCVSYGTRAKLGRQLDDAIRLVGKDGILLVDNGAYSMWKAGGKTYDAATVKGYEKWAQGVLDRSPQAVAVIPDVIGGTEEQNGRLVQESNLPHERSMPIWHMHESMDYLRGLLERGYDHLGIGSSGDYRDPGTAAWHNRINEALALVKQVEDENGNGGVRPRIHMMRAQSQAHLHPFDSSDSTNVAVNHGRFGKAHPGPDRVARMGGGISERIQDSATGVPAPHQELRPLDDHVKQAQWEHDKQLGDLANWFHSNFELVKRQGDFGFSEGNPDYTGEKITAAAIKFDDGKVFTHASHIDAIEDAENAGYSLTKTGVQDGFVTSTGRFVDRNEAWEIANKASQVDQQIAEWRGDSDTESLSAETISKFEDRSPGYYFDARSSPLYRQRTAEDVKVTPTAEAEKALQTDATARRILAKGVKIRNGELVGARLNINVMKKTGVPVMTIHKGNTGAGYQHNKGFWNGEVIGYQPIVTLKDAYLNVHQQGREAIATGQHSKFPMASVDGKFVNAAPNFNGVEFRFNPKREHLFVDEQGRVLRHADEVTLHGNSAFARGHIEYYSAEDVPARAGDAPTRGHLMEPEQQAAFADTTARYGGAGTPPPRQPPYPPPPAPPPPSGAYRRLSARVANALGTETAIKLKEGFSDYNKRVQLLQNDVEALRHQWIDPEGNLPDEHQFYVLKRLFPGKKADRIDAFNREHFEPLGKLLRDSGITLQELGDLAYAMHAPERNRIKGALYAQTVLQQPHEHDFSRARREHDVVGASGMSTNEANRIRDQFLNSPRGPAFRQLLARVTSIRTWIQREALRGGLVNRETVDEQNRTYNHYVPLKEWDNPEDTPDHAAPNSGGRGRGDVRGPENKYAFGRRTKADNPVAHLIAQAYRTVDRAERNRVFNSMANALASLTRAHAPIGKELGIHLNRGRPKQEVDPNTGMVRTVDATMDRFGDNAVQFKRGGQPLYFVFDDRAVADAVRRWSPAEVHGVFHAWLWLTNKLKSMWTHYSPNFLVRHNARYYVESIENAMELKETGVHHPVTHARQALPIVGAATRAIFAVEGGLTSASPGLAPEQADLMRSYELMKQHGGVMAMRTMRDIDQIKEDLRVRLNNAGRTKRDPIRIWRQAIETMNHISSVWDNAQRLATMHAALKQGRTPQQAALMARDATIDYQLRGLWSNMMGVWQPFFNTAMRTGLRLGGAFSRSKIMRGVFFGTMALGLAASAWNYLIGGKDTDGVPFFDKIPEWERAKALIILVPWLKDEKGRPQAVKFPFPYNWAAPLAAGYGLGNFMWGSEKFGTVLKTMFIKPFVSTFSQIGEEGISTRSIIPEVVRPAYDIATNTDWAGRPIHVDPKFQTAANAYSGKGDYGGRVRTGEGWKYIAEALNFAGGGNRNKAGLFDFYPEDIREVLKPFIGTQIDLGNEVKETAKSIVRLEKPKSTTVPLARVFFGQDYDAADHAHAYERQRAADHPWLR